LVLDERRLFCCVLRESSFFPSPKAAKVINDAVTNTAVTNFLLKKGFIAMLIFICKAKTSKKN
jgi:hypothetical protein